MGKSLINNNLHESVIFYENVNYKRYRHQTGLKTNYFNEKWSLWSIEYVTLFFDNDQ
jgi:hypothetical protein